GEGECSAVPVFHGSAVFEACGLFIGVLVVVVKEFLKGGAGSGAIARARGVAGGVGDGRWQVNKPLFLSLSPSPAFVGLRRGKGGERGEHILGAFSQGRTAARSQRGPTLG